MAEALSNLAFLALFVIPFAACAIMAAVIAIGED